MVSFAEEHGMFGKATRILLRTAKRVRVASKGRSAECGGPRPKAYGALCSNKLVKLSNSPAQAIKFGAVWSRGCGPGYVPGWTRSR